MDQRGFRTPDGTAVPAVTADEMREIDRIAVEDFNLTLLQMMENAGRNLAAHSRALRTDGPVVVIAGAGGNGGGGLVCARHLTNRNLPVVVIVDREPSELEEAAATQHEILKAMEVSITTDRDPMSSAGLLVDALIGYGLSDAPRGRAADLIRDAGAAPASMLSLDVPSGYDATTGNAPGVAIEPDRTLTLALPKVGLRDIPGELYLADISIPAGVYERCDLPYTNPFRDGYSVLITAEVERD